MLSTTELQVNIGSFAVRGNKQVLFPGNRAVEPYDGTALITNVLKRHGQRVLTGETLVEYERDKLADVVHSPTSGKIVGVHVRRGDLVEPGNPLFTLE